MTAAGATIGKSFLYVDEAPACYAGYLVRFRPRREADPRFIAYWTESVPYWDQIKTGKVVSTIENFSASKYKNLCLAVPPRAAQEAIADYLDHETARFDDLIAAKQRMIALLNENQSEVATQLLLGHPVVGGTAGPGQVSLREGWTMVPFRRLFREVDVRSETGSETLLSVSQTRGVIPQTELGDRRQNAETLVGHKRCRAGDLVVNRMWVYYGALGAAPNSGIVSPDYAVFRPTAQMSSEFAAYVLRTPAYVGEMTRLVRGIGAAFQGSVRKPRLHPNEMGLIELPLPPLTDQQRLLRQLDQASDAITRRVSLIQQSIALLQERRQALITAAVTGQFNIPQAA
jgi:type I restriction enzyme S subunit